MKRKKNERWKIEYSRSHLWLSCAIFTLVSFTHSRTHVMKCAVCEIAAGGDWIQRDREIRARSVAVTTTTASAFASPISTKTSHKHTHSVRTLNDVFRLWLLSLCRCCFAIAVAASHFISFLFLLRLLLLLQFVSIAISFSTRVNINSANFSLLYLEWQINSCKHVRLPANDTIYENKYTWSEMKCNEMKVDWSDKIRTAQS